MVTFDFWDFTGSLHYKSVYSCFHCKDSLHLAVFDINTGKFYWHSVSPFLYVSVSVSVFLSVSLSLCLSLCCVAAPQM